MHQKKLAILLLKPSLLSGIACFVVAVGLLVYTNYSFIVGDPVLEEYLFGQYGIVTIFEAYFARVAAYISSLMPEQTVSYNILVLVAAAVIGLLTYIVLQISTKFLATVLGDYLTISDTEETDTPTAVEVGLRWIVRLVSFALWVVYWFLFVAVIVPFCILAARVGANDLLSVAVWATILVSVFILFAALHIHVIFLRLLTLRPRVFGGREDVIEASAHEFGRY